MSKWIKLAAVAVAGLLVVMAVQAARDDSPRSRPDVVRAVAREDYQPAIGQYGGRLIRASISGPKSFNPVTSGETSTTEYTGYMYLGLTRTDPWTGEVVPELALSWEPDESGLVWTVVLRQGVHWSDGTPFTADDVVFTYETIYNPDITSSTRDVISGSDGQRWQIEKIDDHTLRFTLYDRNAIFPQIIGTSIIPRHVHEAQVRAGIFNAAMGSNSRPEDLVVTGPFKLGQHVPGQRVTLVRNDRYYRTDAAGNRLPYLDGIVTLVVPNTDVQALKFLQGETDINGVTGRDFPNFVKPQKQADFTLYRLGPSMGANYIVFNQNTGTAPNGRPFVAPHKQRWFRDVRFRRAISHAIDRQYIIDAVMNGLGYPLHGPMNTVGELYFANPDIQRFEYDLDKARALLAEMGLVDRNGDGYLQDEQGNRVEFNLATNSENELRQQMAAIIRQDLENLGIRVNYRPMDFNALISRLDYNFDWDAVVMGLTGGTEPAWGSNVWRSSGRLHMWFPRQETPSTEWEAEIDELFARGMATLEPEKRREIYFRWQEIVGEQQPFVYTVTSEDIVAMRNRFGNVFASPLGGVLHNIHEIYVLPGTAAPPVAEPGADDDGDLNE